MLFKLRPVIRIAFIEIALLAVLLLSALYFVKTSNEKQLEVRAHTSAQLLATMTTNAVVALDLATLDALVSEAMKNSDIIFVRVRDRDGVELSKYGRPPKKNIVDTFDETSRISEGRIDVTTSISIESVNFGFVDIGLETKFLHATLVEAAKWMLFVAGVQLILVGLLGISLGSALTNQLTALKDAAQRVAAGGLGFQTGVQGDNELANVARSFNTMSSSLALLVRGLKQARIDAEKEREAAESILQDVVLNLSEGVLISNSRGQIIHINEKFNEIHDDNFSRSKIQDLRTFDLLLAKEIGFIIKGQASEEQLTVGNNDCKIVSPFIEFSSTCLKGQWTCCYVNQKIVLYTASPLSNGGHLFIASDITFIHQFEKLAKRLQRELAQSRKMEAAGALAGGISHELNTPMQFVGDNLSFIKVALTDLSEIIDQHISLLESLEDNSEMVDSSPMAEALKASDYEFLKDELPKAIEQSINGINQMANNVLAMKECAHPTQKREIIENLPNNCVALAKRC